MGVYISDVTHKIVYIHWALHSVTCPTAWNAVAWDVWLGWINPVNTIKSLVQVTCATIVTIVNQHCYKVFKWKIKIRVVRFVFVVSSLVIVVLSSKLIILIDTLWFKVIVCWLFAVTFTTRNTRFHQLVIAIKQIHILCRFTAWAPDGCLLHNKRNESHIFI